MNNLLLQSRFLSSFLPGGKDISTKVHTQECPECGKTHKSNKHLACSKKCYLKIKARTKNNG